MMKCKYRDPEDPLSTCDNEVDTKPDKSKPSCDWFRFSDKVSEVAMFPSRECAHGLCSYHARKLYYEKLGVGRES